MTTPNGDPQALPNQQADNPFAGMNKIEQFNAWMQLTRALQFDERGVVDVERAANDFGRQVAGLGPVMMMGSNVEMDPGSVDTAAAQASAEAGTDEPLEEQVSGSQVNASEKSTPERSLSEILREDVKELPFQLMHLDRNGTKTQVLDNVHAAEAADYRGDRRRAPKDLPESPDWQETTVTLLDIAKSEAVTATLVKGVTYKDFTGEKTSTVAKVDVMPVVVQYAAYSQTEYLDHGLNTKGMDEQPVGFSIVTSVGHARKLVAEAARNPQLMRDMLIDYIQAAKAEDSELADRLDKEVHVPDFDDMDATGDRKMVISAHDLRSRDGTNYSVLINPSEVLAAARQSNAA